MSSVTNPPTPLGYSWVVEVITLKLTEYPRYIMKMVSQKSYFPKILETKNQCHHIFRLNQMIKPNVV